MLQPTSPIRFSGDISKAINYYEKNRLDSLFSYVNFHSLFWKRRGKKLSAINYSPKNVKTVKICQIILLKMDQYTYSRQNCFLSITADYLEKLEVMR